VCKIVTQSEKNLEHGRFFGAISFDRRYLFFMHYMFYGNGNALEHETYLRFAAGLSARDKLYFALNGSHALLRACPGVIPVTSLDQAIAVARHHAIDMVLLWSPPPLMQGAYDRFKSAGFQVFGLPLDTVQLEASKVVGKKLMEEKGVPTPASHAFYEAERAHQFLNDNWVDGEREFVIKSDMFLANASYRASVPSSLEEAHMDLANLARIYEQGSAMAPILVEEKLHGPEVSLHVLFDGQHYQILPHVSDYKRLFEGDQGPNTQGIGAVSSPSFLSEALLREIREDIVEPTLEGILQRGLFYRYVLYIGLMLTEKGVRVLEYNVRPGSPEWPTLLALLDTPLHEVVHALCEGRLATSDIRWRRDLYAASLVAVSAGYPFAERSYREPITGLDRVSDEVRLAGDGIAARDGSLVVSGGRVFAMIARGRTIDEVRSTLYQNVDAVRFNGMFYRGDIGVGFQ
jgi:phosphoribosylamine---glycine ligase